MLRQGLFQHSHTSMKWHRVERQRQRQTADDLMYLMNTSELPFRAASLLVKVVCSCTCSCVSGGQSTGSLEIRTFYDERYAAQRESVRKLWMSLQGYESQQHRPRINVASCKILWQLLKMRRIDFTWTGPVCVVIICCRQHIRSTSGLNFPCNSFYISIKWILKNIHSTM